jgi:CDP-paratose 2-epimerase
LGSNIAAAYLAAGADVVIVDALYRQGSQQNKTWLESLSTPGRLTLNYFDLAEAHHVDTLFKAHAPFDYICHLGGQVAMTTSLSDPRRDLMTNVVGTFNILEAMRQYSPQALLAYSSTNKVYGDLKHLTYVETASRFTVPAYPQGFNESLPLDFASPYGCSKGSADQYVRDWPRNFGLKTVVFRHSSIYGGRQFSTFDQGWIGWFCQKALEQKQNPKAKPFTISGTGKQVRDVLHAEDLVRLYQAAYQHRDAAAGEIFNIGGGLANSLSLLELFTLLEKQLDLTLPLQFERLPRRQSDQDFFVADISKAHRLLNWQPQVSSTVGIARMLNWCQTSEPQPRT